MKIDVPVRMLLSAVLFFPMTLFYFGLGTSGALGVSAVAILIILMLLSVPGRMRSSILSAVVMIVPLLIFVLVHLLVAGGFLEIDYARAIPSLAPLFVMVVAGMALGKMFFLSRDFAFRRAVFLCFSIMGLAAFFGILGLEPPAPPGLSYAVPVFPFTEPSHLALEFVPVLMFCCLASTGRTRLFLMCVGIAIAGLLQSLTLVVGLVIIIIVCSRGIILPVMAVVLGAIASVIDITYYTDRLSFGNTTNTSTLVYVQGWQLLLRAFPQSGGWGIGFQQFGLHDASSTATDALQLLTGNKVNILDGGFTFAKLAGEFGIFGVAATLFLLLVAAMAFFRLRKVARGQLFLNSPTKFSYCILLSYPLELFVRGAGYFTPTTLLVFASLTMILRRKPASHRVRRIDTKPLLNGPQSPDASIA
jgi:hypothetical protein